MNTPLRQKKPPLQQSRAEAKRLRAMQRFDSALRGISYLTVAGVDEAGRGPLAGPVVAAACMISDGVLVPGIDDSKKLTPARRDQLFLFLTEHPEVRFGVGVVDSSIIDEINIYQATIKAMQIAVDHLPTPPNHLFVDGLALPHPIPSTKVIRGDAQSLLIASASVIAKVTRDRIMLEMDQKWPFYGFAQHKGYGTPQHLKALDSYGPCEIHRQTFAPVAKIAARGVQIVVPGKGLGG